MLAAQMPDSAHPWASAKRDARRLILAGKKLEVFRNLKITRAFKHLSSSFTPVSVNQNFNLQEVPVLLLQVEQSLGPKQKYKTGPKLKCESLESLIKVCEIS